MKAIGQLATFVFVSCSSLIVATVGCGGSGGNAASDTSGGAAAAGTCSPSPPSALPSTQTITVRVTNAGAAEVWVMTRGAQCSALGIERLSPSPEAVYLTGTSLLPGNFCCGSGTSCDFDVGPAAYGRLLPGETMDMPWDARGLVADPCMLECRTDQYSQLTAFQPVPAGRYTVSVGYENAPGCVLDKTTGTTGLCSTPFGGVASLEKQCAGTTYANAQFELQAGVNLVVPVAIP
jgi:hypothetical protein